MSAAWNSAVQALERKLDGLEPGPGLRLRLPDGRPPAPSAVLAAFLPPATLVLTVRGAELSAHAGQVSFPGGKPEPGDDSLLDAALRETHEELGIPPEALDVLGALTPVPTPSGFLIHPFVARWTGRGEAPVPRPQSSEVAAVILAPLEVLLRPGVHRLRQLDWRGQRLPSHEYELPELELADGQSQPPTRIWGATGRITRELVELARG